ncbi:MAG: ATP-binding protein [Gaiellaceae bacterium MAG52_C11]|nr:ATP-binding protein [Candidatus Gaiellasilicea maunaloa]
MAEETNGNAAISDEDVIRLLPALAEAERATEATAARFVPPRPGILEEVSARRHQFVYGRRGVGKSTLLHRVAAVGSENNRAVIFVDIETLRGRPYPDVLIELLKELLDHLEERLRADGRFTSWKRRKLRRRVRDLASAMSQLLQAPQLAEHTVSTLRSQASQAKKGWSLGGSGQLGAQAHGAKATATAAGQIDRTDEKHETAQATVAAKFEKTKMDGLVEAAILIRDVLGEAQKELEVPTLVVLDDFYHIPLDDQPDVLAYLHQIVKGLDISLKVCGVRRLLRPYAAGDPPVGMQPEHDAGTIPLDITLERFEVAKQFLERVLSGISTPLGIELNRLLTDGGRERLVLASGGVARDYLSLVRRALRNATERPSHQWRVKNRITAEDVAQAATDLYGQKQEELKQDAGDEAEALRSRLSEIVRFCVETRRTNVFLVETTKLQEEDWGKDVEALADLRFIHRVDTLSTKRGGETYAGRKFAAFTLDLSTWTSTRSEQISPINFWEREGRQKIRDPKLIYTPTAGEPVAVAASPLAKDEQLTFEFEDPAAIPGD